MSDDDFKDIFNNGFGLKVENEDSELKCLNCKKNTELKNIGNSENENFKIVCEDGHEWQLLDYTTKWINIRDGLLIKQLDNACSFNFRQSTEE